MWPFRDELKGAYVIVLTRITTHVSSLIVLGHSSCSHFFWAMTMSTTSWSHHWAMTTSTGFRLILVSKRAGHTVRGEIWFLQSPPKAGLNRRKVKRIADVIGLTSIIIHVSSLKIVGHSSWSHSFSAMTTSTTS